MRIGSVFLVIVIAVISYSWGRTIGASATPTKNVQPARPLFTSNAKVDFATQVEPILKSKCQGCHFRGGKMYEKLPFDRPETIKHLGTKLFTRISDESDRKVIREFLSQE
jgi:hypothetical protein